jgi:hypothetical protein
MGHIISHVLLGHLQTKVVVLHGCVMANVGSGSRPGGVDPLARTETAGSWPMERSVKSDALIDFQHSGLAPATFAERWRFDTPQLLTRRGPWRGA